MLICPYCHEKLDNVNPNAKFCPSCGHKFEHCATCGNILVKKIKFCPNDGTPVPQEVYDALPDAAPAPAPLPANPYGATPIPEAPAPANPYGATPIPEAPAPASPYGATPIPEEAAPVNPYGAIPVPEAPASETPITRTVEPGTRRTLPTRSLRNRNGASSSASGNSGAVRPRNTGSTTSDSSVVRPRNTGSNKSGSSKANDLAEALKSATNGSGDSNVVRPRNTGSSSGDSKVVRPRNTGSNRSGSSGVVRPGNTSGSGDGKSNTTMILGIVAGVLAVVVVILAIFILKPGLLPFGKGEDVVSNTAEQLEATESESEMIESEQLPETETEIQPVEETPSEIPAEIQPVEEVAEPVVEEPEVLEPVEEESEYFCDWISTAYLTDSAYWEIYEKYRDTEFPGGRKLAQMMINELHAKNGYTFTDQELQRYFEAKEWYREIQRTMNMTNDKDTAAGRMNKYEKENCSFLARYR